MHKPLQDLPGVIYEYVIRQDNSRAFLSVSANAQSILGLTPQQLMDDPLSLRKIIHPDDLPEFDKTLLVSHTNNASWNWEGRIILNRDVRWIETRSHAFVLEDHVLRKGIVIDITERKKAELIKELHYQSLVDSLPLGVGIHVQGKIVMANAHAHTLMAAKPGELIGRNVLEFVHPDYKDIVIERMKRVMAGESLPATEERFFKLDGKLIDVETMALPFTFKGMPASQLIVRDITEEKRVKEEIKRNETFFTQLFNVVPMAVVMLDSTGKVELVNKGFTEMFGYSLHELKGKNLNDHIVPEEFRNEGIDFNNLITSDQVIRVEAVRKQKEGKLVNVILYGMPVRMDEEVIGIFGVYVDITERKRMEEELRIRNAELDNFVYKVSHDLRAPLSSILGLVNLSKYPDNPDSPYEYINLIGEKVKSLDHFIGDVLSHSKNLKLELAIEKIDLKEILSKTIFDLSYLDGAAEVQFDIQSKSSEIYSDRWRISEIFRNLVSNAIKYRQLENPKSGVTVKIGVAKGMARIEFSDNGIGIEEENVDKVFEMFFRATEQSDGSGIGLYIVKNAVEKLGGTIAVKSTIGKGTTFMISLPDMTPVAKKMM